MATPEQLRSDIDTLVREARADVARLRRQALDPKALNAALHDILPPLVDTYGLAAASVAADWYDEYRDGMEVSGRFRALAADIRDSGVHELIGWAEAEAATTDSLWPLIEGGLQRRITNFSRKSIMDSTSADPRADGWQRVGSGECQFCEMLIGRGAVYTESTADFAAHDDCKCNAVPAFGGKPRPVKPYTPSERGSEADQARAKAWIAKNL